MFLDFKLNFQEQFENMLNKVNNHTVNFNQNYTVNRVCNCLLADIPLPAPLKDISFNTKCLLFCCD